MKKRDLMKNIRNIAYEFQTKSLRLNQNLDTASYIFGKLSDINCSIMNSTKLETKEKIEKLLNFIKLELENKTIRPLIDLKNKLIGVKKSL